MNTLSALYPENKAVQLLGLICFPKSISLDHVTDEEIEFIQDRLNNGPSKLLGYKVPNEVHDAMRLAE